MKSIIKKNKNLFKPTFIIKNRFTDCINCSFSFVPSIIPFFITNYKLNS